MGINAYGQEMIIEAIEEEMNEASSDEIKSLTYELTQAKNHLQKIKSWEVSSDLVGGVYRQAPSPAFDFRQMNVDGNGIYSINNPNDILDMDELKLNNLSIIELSELRRNLNLEAFNQIESFIADGKTRNEAEEMVEDMPILQAIDKIKELSLEKEFEAQQIIKGVSMNESITKTAKESNAAENAADEQRYGKPTDKQIEYAEKIATQKDLKIPKEALTSQKEMREFLDKHSPKVSDKQIQYAIKIAKEKDIELPDYLHTDLKVMKEFLNEHAPKLGRESDTDEDKRPPTDKQLGFAEKLAARKDVDIPKEALTSQKEMREFLDKHSPKVSIKQKSFANSIAKNKGLELPDNIMTDTRVMSSFLKEHGKPGNRAAAYAATKQKEPSEKTR